MTPRSARRLVAAGAVLGGLGVACGAFGAHGVAGFVVERYPDAALAARRLENWQTAADYHLWHALAVIACGLLALHAAPGRGGALTAAAGCFAAGVLVFSGSLYLLTLTGLTWLGAVTPIGGVLLMLGWALLAWAAWRGGADG
ncbi:DUF423 domain-containing protein [Alienimonas californiensis]|uniref:DUF423 domain-containing protein n=1 Tax=Alienimonas californiensis TaxID=2527989 RepID=A0A517P7I7_9PLAN|nr:DUF423 domain-containing protein [Alienimonas californiensis]QDT15315.1 hypothetical protein CA12_13980 [Alienimonas californiensis]